MANLVIFGKKRNFWISITVLW